ncbi:MAG: class F sortase [Actinomycetota bacterium]|nr:class F sortase [Actinomycetota bacterium]
MVQQSLNALAINGLVLPASQPVSLSIPAINISSSSLLNLGRLPDGTIAVPPVDDPHGKAGWYNGSPTPGTLGPSVILGHVDSAKYGPSIFYSIGSLKPGDEVSVTRKDGIVAVFKIDGVRSYSKTAFPTQEIYGNLNYAGLRLITCGGTFDPSSGHYQSNIIAFATLVSSHKA